MFCPSTSKRLVVNVKRRVIVLAQDALAQPVLEKPAARAVSVCHAAVAGLIPVQLEPDDVIRAGLVELVLQAGVDHVVGRRHHVGERADTGHVVADTAEGTSYQASLDDPC